MLKRGWTAKLIKTENFGVKRPRMILKHSETDLDIVLPAWVDNKVVDPVHLLNVRNVLEYSGFWENPMRQSQNESPNQTIQVLQSLERLRWSCPPFYARGLRYTSLPQRAIIFKKRALSIGCLRNMIDLSEQIDIWSDFSWSHGSGNIPVYPGIFCKWML